MRRSPYAGDVQAKGTGNVDEGELLVEDDVYVGYRDSLCRYLAWCKAFRRRIFPLISSYFRRFIREQRYGCHRPDDVTMIGARSINRIK